MNLWEYIEGEDHPVLTSLGSTSTSSAVPVASPYIRESPENKCLKRPFCHPRPHRNPYQE
jgi:hypothetical protein